ncbi:MAG: pyruvate kinase [Thermoprotei archaeon]
MRFTKIVCTIGPVTSSVPAVKKLISCGMDVARLNFSHGTVGEHEERIRIIRKASSELGLETGILQDLPGPKMRVGRIIGEPVRLVRGRTVVLTTRRLNGNSETIPVLYRDFPRAVREGSAVYLADGTIRLKVSKVEEDEVVCSVELGGLLASGKGVNVPSVSSDVDAVTEEDASYIEFGAKQGIDFVAVSFVRSGRDVERARKLVNQYNGTAQIVAKIEKREAVENFKEIVSASDCVMVARGDLGVELGIENVPMAQKKIIAEANRQGKPVITATQILLSMLSDPTPTRAEVSDIANAIIDGSDALMLSEETAVGKYYAEAVTVLSRVAQTVEKELEYTPKPVISAESTEEAVGTAACSVAHAVGAKFILAYTRSGSTARQVARHRPRIPIRALTVDKRVIRQLKLVCGVEPYHNPRNVGALDSETVERHVKRLGLVKKGELIVVVAGSPTGPAGSTNMLRVQKMG